MCLINTSADVKAETDVCCTSANAVKVVELLNVDKVIFSDQYLADYVSNTKVKIISWKGTCSYEQFTGKIEDIKSKPKSYCTPEYPPA